MAITVIRSCNAELHEGMTDGGWKKAIMHRGGFVEGDLAGVRRCMSGVWHGFHEAQPKWLPDGRQVSTQNYIDVSPMDLENV